MNELDEVPTILKLNKAIDSMSAAKPLDVTLSPPGLLKQCKTTLYKNKGDRSDCNNYRGIALLSIVGKVFARVILLKPQKLADRVNPESQCGFCSGRSTIDMTFSIRHLQEKCREQRMPLYIAFIDKGV
uniref:Reverse transcriptase domain-containing protein n=1 Tax=Biomphalaria glabrata TaxID=6526 RepID=A0A2C9LM67_BIOGL